MRFLRGLPLIAAALLTLNVQSHVTAPALSVLPGMPRVTVWAWQRREDLRSVDARTTAVADLRRTIHLAGDTVVVEAQRNTLVLPVDAKRIAVIRIDSKDIPLTIASVEAVVDDAVNALQPGDRVLQVDFDAVKSQQGWYRELLVELRRRMPHWMPLSITALASWCTTDRWMGGLPVDEAVPMLFRMEPDHRRGARYDAAHADPLCRASVGISTLEAWPHGLAAQRVYIFPDRGWREDDLRETVGELR
ncbi:DUF3142 domain-containing protein [Terriglobus saanensis]|uniref:DUF3142 domain-containing protein n=1 Tax=Terriglobus saanensis (strain ATCC BAA-1853 / DSM 23119 / SP1PR4) TaxID=401053 RepID=E8UZS1_TERSS|nr:DUF3142 domain-containing protein [Terriglobus saanensis]ADV80998.1 hypothetical protein AciPR4_0159 [Terriglobus saanensis SP1PR4]